ncbi:hypothetical protein [Sphingomonas sp. SAFR-052]|uniref:hypothetical protein n=1 Tax=Sphingomonas sp. SAFR-052 TaxID=3436867 RepID=UPI003F7F69A3
MIGMLWASIAPVALSAASPPVAPSFCQRMAAELPMKEKRVAGTRRAIDLQMLTAGQRWLTGGSTSFSMRLDPVDDTPGERERVENMCRSSPCTMEGPLRFTLGLKDGTVRVFDGRAGERMRVEMVGTRIRCSDL